MAAPAAGATAMTAPAAAGLVDSWSCPTIVHASRAVRHRLAAITGPGPWVLATDAQLLALDSLAGILAEPGVVELVVRHPEQADLDFLDRVLEALRANPSATPVGIGGGTVLDPIRLADLIATHPPARDLVAPATGGFRFLPGGPGAVGRVVALPTTLGTAAEVSPVAVVRDAGVTTLVASPALRARAAVLDPELTRSLDRSQLLSGLVEPLARAIVPAITGHPLLLQDRVAASLADAIRDLGALASSDAPPAADATGRRDGGCDLDWHLAAALTSLQTHTALLALGRSPFAMSLWPVATELAAACRTSKPAALAGLLPAWIAGIGTTLGPAFGSARRVQQVLGASNLSDMPWLGSVATCPEDAPHPESLAVATAVVTRWQRGGPFLPGASLAELEWLVAAACSHLRPASRAGANSSVLG